VSKDKTTYELVVKKQRIEVSKEVYRAYYECRDREVYLDKVHKKHNESLEALQESGFSIECNSSLISKESAEDKAINKILIDQLKISMKLLKPEDLFLIREIYVKGVSERELAKQLNVHRKSIYKRKEKVFEKIRKIMAEKNF